MGKYGLWSSIPIIVGTLEKNMIFIYPYENGLITIPKMAIYRIQFFDFWYLLRYPIKKNKNIQKNPNQ